jgi:hypothetical protein
MLTEHAPSRGTNRHQPLKANLGPRPAPDHPNKIERFAVYRKLTANTAAEARDILTEALAAIDAGLQQRGTPNAPLRVTVHFDIDDMDRTDELDVNDCLHLPYDGIPPGLQPHNCHPEYGAYDRAPRRPQRRSLIQRLLNP